MTIVYSPENELIQEMLKVRSAAKRVNIPFEQALRFLLELDAAEVKDMSFHWFLQLTANRIEDHIEERIPF